MEQTRMDPTFEKSELSAEQLKKLIGSKKVDLQEVVQKDLWDGRTHVRRNAAHTIALEAKSKMGSLDLLPIAAKDGDPIVRQHCLRAMAELSLASKLSVPALLRGMSDPIEDVHQTALTSLEKLVNRGAPEADVLVVDALADRRPIVQAQVVELLTRQAKQCVSALIDALNHSHDVVKENAVEILRMLGSSAAAPLIAALNREDIRSAVAHVLRGLTAVEPKDQETLEALVTGDRAELAEIAGSILAGLAKVRDRADESAHRIDLPGFDEETIGEDKLESVLEDLDARAVILAAQDGRTIVRQNAAALLGLLAQDEGERTNAALALVPLSKDPNIDVRRTVIRALGQLGGIEAIDVLITASADPSRGVSDIAKEGLKKVCKSHPKEVLAALRPQQAAVSHRAVIEGLSNTGKKGAKALAQGMLAANHPLRRRIAAQVLGKMGTDSAAEANALLEMLDDMVDDVRLHAARALGAAENNSKEVIAGLSSARQDSVLAVRNEAMWALDRLNGKAESMVVIEATPFPIATFEETVLDAAVLAKEKKLDPFRLKLLLSDGRPTVRINAATALGTLGTKGKEAVRQLALSLKDGNLDFRCAAARALGSIKEEPHIAVPALSTALFQASDKQTETVLAALKAFGSTAVKPLLEGLSQRPERVEGTLLKVVKADPKTYLKGLVQALVEGKNTVIQENAADVITALGSDAASAEESVIQALEFDSVLVRAKVIRALGRIAKPGKALNATLRKIAESDNRIAVLDAVDDAMLYLRARSRK